MKMIAAETEFEMMIVDEIVYNYNNSQIKHVWKKQQFTVNNPNQK
jgi:hypothetical protein